jgi:hypothetical protein
MAHLTVLAVDVAVVTVLLVVTSPTNQVPHLGLPDALSASYALSLATLQRSVGITMRKILLISALLPWPLHLVLNISGTLIQGPQIISRGISTD